MVWEGSPMKHLLSARRRGSRHILERIFGHAAGEVTLLGAILSASGRACIRSYDRPLGSSGEPGHGAAKVRQLTARQGLLWIRPSRFPNPGLKVLPRVPSGDSVARQGRTLLGSPACTLPGGTSPPNTFPTPATWNVLQWCPVSSVRPGI